MNEDYLNSDRRTLTTDLQEQFIPEKKEFLKEIKKLYLNLHICLKI